MQHNSLAQSVLVLVIFFLSVLDIYGLILCGLFTLLVKSVVFTSVASANLINPNYVSVSLLDCIKP